MDESKDHEPGVDNLSESTVTVTTTTVITTSTTTEMVTEEIVEGKGGVVEEGQPVSVAEKAVVAEEGDGGACESGDVMVEVLGSEVFVDGVTRGGGEGGGSDELGGIAGERDNLGNGDGGGGDRDESAGGNVDDAVVLHDGVSVMRQDDSALCGAENLGKESGNGGSLGTNDGVQSGHGDGDGSDGGKVDDPTVPHDGVSVVKQDEPASRGAENLASESGCEGPSGIGSSLATYVGVQDDEAHNLGEQKVVETVDEESLERKLGDENGVTAMDLSGNGDVLHEDLGTHDVEVRSNQIENGARDSMSQMTLTADGSNNADAQQNLDSFKDEVDNKDSAVGDNPSIASKPRSEEPVTLKEVDEHGVSESDAHSQDVSLLRSENKVVAEVEMQDSSIQTQDKDNDIRQVTGKEEAEVIDSMTRDSETANPKLSDLQAQVSIEEKNGNADNASVLTEASDDIVCRSVVDQQLEVLAVKVDRDIVNQSADNWELLPETAVRRGSDTVVVNEETKASAGETNSGKDSELTATIRDRVVVGEEHEDSIVGPETSNFSKQTTLSSEVLENDEEVRCCGSGQKSVTTSEIDQNMKTEPVMLAHMKSSDESSFSCREEAGKMDVEVVLEVKDRVLKSEVLHCVKDEKSIDRDGSSDPSVKNDVFHTTLVAAGVADASGASEEMNDVEGNAMEIDNVRQSPDYFEIHKVDGKIKVDHIKNGDLHPQLEHKVEGTSVIGMDIDGLGTNSEEQGMGCADHQKDIMPNNNMIIENKDSESVLRADIGTGTTAADENLRSVEGGPAALPLDRLQKMDDKVNMGSPILETEVLDVSVAGTTIAESDAGPRQDTFEESEGHSGHEQPTLPDESFVKCVDQAPECKPVTSLGECLDEKATDGVAQVGSNVEVSQEMQEQPGNTDVPVAGNIIADSDAGPRQETCGESESHVGHDQPPLLDESLVDDKPGTSLGEDSHEKATDGVAQVGTNVEDSREMHQQIGNTNVPIAGTTIANLDACPRQDIHENSEGHAAYEEPPLPDESVVKCVDQGLECEPDISLGECLDEKATDDAAHVGSDMEESQEVQEQAGKTDVPIAGSIISDLDAYPRHDKHEESENHASYEQPPLADESLVRCVDQGMECERDISLGECMDNNATDGVAQVSSNVEHSQEMQEQAANSDVSVAGSTIAVSDAGFRQETNAYEQLPLPGSNVDDIQEMEEQFTSTEQIVSLEAAGPSEEYIIKLQDPVTSVVMDKQVIHAEDRTHEVNEKLNMITLISEMEVPDVMIEDCAVVDSDTGPRQDNTEECEGHAAHDRPPSPDESLIIGANQRLECEPDTSLGECLDKSSTDGVAQDGTEEDIEEVQEEAANAEEVELPREQVGQDLVSDSAKPRSKEEKNARRGSTKPGSYVRDHPVTYQLPPENDGEFSVFDLVWGKVKSHPWWPGQIFHPSDSSEKAMKYYRKDCYLVAYFGDRSFAWNEASVLKPFRKHFSQEEKQSNSESFQNALSCALEEVSRRMQLGLACSCISEATYDKIRYQKVENAGIREESSKREGVDRSTGPDTFQPANLLEYVRALAVSPTSGTDRVDLVIAKAQVLAFCRLKGCDALPDFEYYDGLMECDADTSLPGEQGISGESELADSAAGGDGKTRLKGPHKRKHNLKDIVYQRRKEKSLTELMGEYYLDGEFDSHEEDESMLNSPTPGSKRKASGYLTDDYTAQKNTKTISFAKVSHTASQNPQQSFKVGECIRRVASQLTGSPSIIKCASDGSNSKPLEDDADEVVDPPEDSMTESTMIPQKQSSPEEMLSQLQLSARDPMKGYSFLGDIINFFSEFRNMAVSTQRQRMRKGPGRKRKPSAPTVGAPESFEFDDRNDSYWTDMVIQDNPEAKPSRRGRKRKDDQLVAGNPRTPIQSNRRKYSRKQYFHGNHEPAAETPPGDEKKQDQVPTELMLNFSGVGCIPSEVTLNKMFRRFGPLKESETEVDAQSSRARVVFKKRSDAEVAYSSATMFNIFGSMLVNYQLNYTPSVSFGTLPLALSDTLEHGT